MILDFRNLKWSPLCHQKIPILCIDLIEADYILVLTFIVDELVPLVFGQKLDIVGGNAGQEGHKNNKEFHDSSKTFSNVCTKNLQFW